MSLDESDMCGISWARAVPCRLIGWAGQSLVCWLEQHPVWHHQTWPKPRTDHYVHAPHPGWPPPFRAQPWSHARPSAPPPVQTLANRPCHWQRVGDRHGVDTCSIICDTGLKLRIWICSRSSFSSSSVKHLTRMELPSRGRDLIIVPATISWSRSLPNVWSTQRADFALK